MSERSAEKVEGEKERLNRKLEELMQELRVALPGVQIILAFLLILPFSSNFPQKDDLQRNTYFFCFLCAAVASGFLIAPSAYHRMRWRFTDRERLEEKRRMLVTAGRFAGIGIAFLGLAMTGVVFLVSDVMFGLPAAVGATAGMAVVFAWLWFGLPLSRRLREARSGG